MLKKITISIFIFLLCLPAGAQDTERIATLTAEIEQRQIKQYLLPIENYLELSSASQGSTMAEDSIIKALNGLTKKYSTINEMLALTDELIESGYYGSEAPMLLYSFRGAIQKIKNMGFGTAKITPWQFKYMSRFGSLKSVTGEGSCTQMQNAVFHTTAKHPAKNVNFGFYLSAGPGFVDQAKLKTKSIGEDCI